MGEHNASLGAYLTSIACCAVCATITASYSISLRNIAVAVVRVLPSSRVAQWKRAGPITQRSVDRNHALLYFVTNYIYM